MAEQTTRRALIDATITSIHRNGLAETTVGAVTELAGLSRGMVRHTFSSKQEMLAATLELLVDEWTVATEPDPSLDPSIALEASVRTMFAPDVFTDDRVMAWLALSIAASTEPTLRVVRERAQRIWAGQLERSLTRLGLPDAGERAVALLALADGLWLQQALDPGALSRPDAERIALDAASRYLRA